MWLHGVTSERSAVVRIRVLEIYDSDLEHLLTFSLSPERFVAGNRNSNKMLEVPRDERSRGGASWQFLMKTQHHSSLLSESSGLPYTLLPWIGHLSDSLAGFIF